MLRVGVIGLGMMGGTHLDAYAKLGDRIQVVAVSDKDPKRLSGEASAAGNIEGQAQDGFDLKKASIKRYDEGMDLVNDPDVDVVDVCLITPLHKEYAIAAMNAGKHVLIEKPLAGNSEDAQAIAEAASQCKGTVMNAMCMRFWPGWTWLKDAVESKKYGKVIAASFRRIASHPKGGFYSNGDLNGGALLDLHVHDTDFINHLFGIPNRVTTFGYSKVTSAPDHVMTRYEFDGDDAPALVTAEGSWAMADGYGFTMQYCVNFENGTATFDLAAKDTLVFAQDDKNTPIELEDAMGYDKEIEYFITCLENGTEPETVTVAQGADTIRIADAEAESFRTGKTVTLG